MTQIEINKKNYPIPQNWNEINQRQLLQVMKVLFLKKYPAEELVIKLLHVLTGATTAAFYRWPAEEVDEFLYLTKFFLTQEMNFTKNHLPSYKYSHTEFYGPADHLDNLRMKEFTLTEDLYLKWFDSFISEDQKKDIESLNELVAILYRPAPAKYDHDLNPDGDHREKFNQNISCHYARTYVKQWPMKVKLAIATWYAGCRQNIVKINPDVFEGGGDPARYGLVSVMLNVAESHVFGDFEKVEDQYVNLVMMQLNSLVDKARQLNKTT